MNSRDSNMELARIVAMAMIVVGHFFFHGVLGTVIPSPIETPRLGLTDSAILAVSVLCTAGVDLFMLISGFYGIKLKWKSLISLWLLCIFYNAVNLFVNTPLADIGISGIFNVLFISRTPNWFFQGYLWVMMVSPILNKAVREFDIRALRCIVAIGLVLICISSWRFANPDGNTALLLMFVYILGGYIRREELISKVTRKQALATFCSIFVFGVTLAIFVYDLFHKEYGIFFQHNSILVIGMAVSLFLFFRKCNIQSKFINVWASTVVAALFIQDVILFRPLYGYVNGLYLNEGLGVHVWLTIALLTIAIFVVAFIIEWPRRKVAGVIANALSVRLNRIVNIGEILGNESK